MTGYAYDAPGRCMEMYVLGAYHLTGKERDTETGLDYFGARYYGSSVGRFTNPDDPLTFADPDNPQSWNLYAYSFNNPLRYSDADGHEPCVNGVNPENGNICTTVQAPKPADPPPPPTAKANAFPWTWPIIMWGEASLSVSTRIAGTIGLGIGYLMSPEETAPEDKDTIDAPTNPGRRI